MAQRQQKAAQLKDRTNRVSVMNDHELVELRAEIKVVIFHLALWSLILLSKGARMATHIVGGVHIINIRHLRSYMTIAGQE